MRKIAGIEAHATVNSNNNFPTGAGIASSASAFAALALAASHAADLDFEHWKNYPGWRALARVPPAVLFPGGFVEWYPGEDHETSYAASIAPAEHWDLVDCVAVSSVKCTNAQAQPKVIKAPTAVCYRMPAWPMHPTDWICAEKLC